MDTDTGTRTSYTRNDDGTVSLLLRLPAGADLADLAAYADSCHEAYSHGADDDGEAALDKLVLGPLAGLLGRAAHDA